MMEAEDYTFAEMADITSSMVVPTAMHMRQGACIKKHFRIVDFHAAEHFRA
jgi:hypothetical protein